MPLIVELIIMVAGLAMCTFGWALRDQNKPAFVGILGMMLLALSIVSIVPVGDRSGADRPPSAPVASQSVSIR